MNIENEPTLSPGAEIQQVHVVLVPGYWLGAWAWEAVEPGLRAAGLTPHPVTLPGLDAAPAPGTTLDDHIDAVVDLVDTLEGDVVLVGHSGGGLVVQGVIDRQPDRIRRVVYVDSGPLKGGVSLHPDAAADIELPSWDDLVDQGSSIEGVADADLDRFRRRAVPHPAGVAGARVHLGNPRRLDVPASVICTSFSSSVLKEMIEGGQIPSELLAVHHVRYVDLPTGHWPMFSRPTDLAEAIAGEVARTEP